MTYNINLIVKIAIIMSIVDILWIYFIFNKPFVGMLENIQNSKIDFKIHRAIIAYIILISAGSVFIPKAKSIYEAFIFGALIYAVYDSTNFATLNEYKASLALIDTLWGGVLFAITYWLINI